MMTRLWEDGAPRQDMIYGLTVAPFMGAQMITHSGKMVLFDKMMGKLRKEGHKVLIFSQFVRVLDLLQNYCLVKQYPSERIDGGIRGNLRQVTLQTPFMALWYKCVAILSTAAEIAFVARVLFDDTHPSRV